jgi:hypothetical protein
VTQALNEPTLKGVQPVRGVLFCSASESRDERHGRNESSDAGQRLMREQHGAEIMALWQPGATLSWVEQEATFLVGTSRQGVTQSLLLSLPQAQYLDTATLGGMALIQCGAGRTLASAPRAPAALHGAALLIVRGHAWQAIDRAALRPLDASTWLDLTAYPCLSALADRPTSELAVAQLASTAAVDTRALLGAKLQPPDPGLAAFLAARVAGRAGETGHTPSTGANSRMFGALTDLVKSVLGSGKDWLFKPSGPSKRPDGKAQAGVLGRKNSLAELLTRASNFIGVSRLMGLQHAAFLSKMLRDFDSGNFTEALRRAIPLGDGATPDASSPQKLGFLRPQHGLAWTNGIASTIGVSAEFVSYLAECYRASFRALDKAGRIEEAAYVLIELLRETDEGIEYLARHGEYFKAAELAAARQLAPARVVRLWLLAGENARAYRHARLTRCFPAALQLLADRPDIAQQLRLEWAERLAGEHQYASAVEAIWPLAQQRERAKSWLALAKQQNSDLAPQLIACELTLDSDSLTELTPALNAFFADASEAAALERERLAGFLLRGRANLATRRVASALIRVLLADFSRGRLPGDTVLLHRLEKYAEDPLWNADRARGELAPLRETLRTRNSPLELRAALAAEQVIFDVQALPNGRYLVALGDAGVVLVDANGRRLHYFKAPAHQLIGDIGAQNAFENRSHGIRTIALAHRQSGLESSAQPGQSKRVELAILDLHTRTEFPWCSTVLSCYAAQFDGQLWAVGVERSLLVIDVPSTPDSRAFEAIWHVGELPGAVHCIDLSVSALRLLLVHSVAPSLVHPERVERHVFDYRWPELTLAKRTVLEDTPPQNPAAASEAALVLPWQNLKLKPPVETPFFDERGVAFYRYEAQPSLSAHRAAPPVPAHLPHLVQSFSQRAPWRLHFPALHTTALGADDAPLRDAASVRPRAGVPADVIASFRGWLAVQFAAGHVGHSAEPPNPGAAPNTFPADSFAKANKFEFQVLPRQNNTPSLSYVFDLANHKPLITFAITGALPTLAGDAHSVFCFAGSEVIHVSLETGKVRRFSI